MNSGRRLVLRSLGAGGVALIALGSGLLPVRRGLAAWPQAVFEQSELDRSLQALIDGAEIEESGAVHLDAPDVAENGALVPITVSTELDDVRAIHLLVEHNPVPWIASFEMTPYSLPEFSTRIRMSETSRVIALVQTANGFYSSSRQVRVTVSGCAI